VTYPVDRIEFTLIAVGGAFVILLIIKNFTRRNK